MSLPTRRLRRGTALAAGALALAVAAPPAAQAEVAGASPAYGATANGRVLTFSLESPLAVSARRISGLAAGDRVVGIDERPVGGALYAVTKGSGGAGRVYTINPATGQATFAFALVAAGRTAAGQPAAPIVLSGSRFGVDFNPAADALRIVGNTGQNLRALPSDRVAAGVGRFAGDTFTDGTLSYVPVTSGPRPAESGVDAAAYTNSDTDPATGTALFDIDAVAQRDLVAQNPPNDGTLTKVADLDIGVRQVQGFDIRGTDEAFVALGGVRLPLFLEAILLGRQVVPTSVPVRIVSLNLTTGAIAERGLLGTGSPLVGFTIDIPA
ncbi:MAG: DUF4394 domain-containing protein [Solirubrobacteraceae bacterium]|nr:DUF4394 domain-containing protein [Solirubrobacteraceae bacterium]